MVTMDDNSAIVSRVIHLKSNTGVIRPISGTLAN